jgi:multicomponent Na+:H+ antiporter subunit E
MSDRTDAEESTRSNQCLLRVPRWLPIAGVLAVLWLFVRGVELTPTRLLAEGITGLAVGVPVAFVLRRFYRPRLNLARSLRVVPTAVHYTLLFLRELLVANLDVARRVLDPRMPIQPAVIEFPLRVQSDAGITTIANSITLTPGTLSLDYDETHNTLYVHALAADDAQSVVAPIRSWESLALIIFDEPRDPGDAPPLPARRVPRVEPSAAVQETTGEVDDSTLASQKEDAADPTDEPNAGGDDDGQ